MNEPKLKQFQHNHPVAFDMVAMLIYLCLVYIWFVHVAPLGRDYRHLALAGAFSRAPDFLPGTAYLHLKTASSTLLGQLVALFGAAGPAYIIFNLVLLYASMVCVYFLGNALIGGRRWLGRLAAALFMANPVHTEAILNYSGGVSELLPTLLGLFSCLVYLHWRHRPGVRILGPLAYWLGALLSPTVFALPVVLLLYELVVVKKGDRRPGPLLLWFFPMAPLWLEGYGPILLELSPAPADRFAPLYFFIYPIGFLPETARTFHEMPWLGWLAATVVGIITGLISRKARRRSITFALLAMVALRLAPITRSVNPVHLIGGGQLFLPHAFFCIALVALFYRMMDHPRWRHTLVGLTTALAIVMFALQVRANHAWLVASDAVRAFQQQAQHADARIGVLPDFQHYRGAPMMLHEAIAFDSPFSRALPAEPLVKVNLVKGMEVDVLKWSDHEALIAVTGAAPLDLAPWPYELAREGGVRSISIPEYRAGKGRSVGEVQTVEIDENRVVLRVTMNQPLPARSLPVPLPSNGRAAHP